MILVDRQQQQLDQLHIEALAGYCAEASRQGERDGLVHCYELFRRAFDEGDEQAWAAVSKQYHSLVCGWILKFASGRFEEDEVGNLANDALTKFWRTLSSKTPLDEHFSHTAELLSYLNRCAVSTVHDVNRRQQSQQRLAMLMVQQAPLAVQYAASIESELANENNSNEQVKIVRRWVEQSVTDSIERQLLKLIFEQGLKPRQVVIADPKNFPDVRTVRRIRERILKRARRSLLFSDINL